MSIWNSQNIQIVWFLATSDTVRANVVFEEMSGDEPVSYQRNKVPGPANPFLGVASGPIGEFEATLQLQPGRLDLIISPKQSFNEQTGLDFLSLDTDKGIAVALDAITRVSDILPSVRLGVVLNMAKTTDSADSAGKLVEQRTGYRVPFSDYSDFVLQLNRRAAISDAGPKPVNRLLRYNVGSFQSFSISAQPGGMTMPITKEQHAALLTVDINTVPDGRIFSKQEALTIFQAMAAEALRIAASGSVASLEQ